MMSNNTPKIDRLEQSVSWVDLSVEPKRNLAELTFHGSVTIDLINGAFLKLIDHPDFKTNMNACYDYTEAIIETNMRDLEAHVQFVLQNLDIRGSNYRLALISNEALNSALLNVYKVKISKSTVEAELFATRKQAIQWLNCDTEILQ